MLLQLFFTTALALTGAAPTASPPSPLPYHDPVSHLPPSLGHALSKRTIFSMKALPAPDSSQPIAGTFYQLLNHSNPSLGTFQQRYWYDAQYWAGPGSPVFLMAGPEADASKYIGYLSDEGIVGQYAKRFGGAAILLEHRYFGKSIPFDRLDAETLQHLTVPNAIHDLTNFARNNFLSFPDPDFDNTTATTNATSPKAPATPWVLIGGSYAGALAAWTSRLSPSTFTAYHASSAVVQSIDDYWAYFDPIAKGLPRNCSTDLKAVISKVDEILDKGNETVVHQLKSMFGMGDVARHEDFAEVLAAPFYRWQGNKKYVLGLCDAIEAPRTKNSTSRSRNATVTLPGPEGVGVAVALQRFAAHISLNEAATCRADPSSCDSYSEDPDFAAAYANSTIDPAHGGHRQWQWLLCHGRLGWWLTGGKASDANRPGIVSTYLTRKHSSRQCDMMFPPVGRFSVEAEREADLVPAKEDTIGWNAPFEKVVFIDGEQDPWRQAGVSSDFRPGGRRKSEGDMKVFVLDGAVHCPELIIDEVAEMSIVDELMGIMGGWLGLDPVAKRDRVVRMKMATRERIVRRKGVELIWSN